MKSPKRDAGVEELLCWAREWPKELKYHTRYSEWTQEIAKKQALYERVLREIDKLPFQQRRVIRENYIKGRTMVCISVDIEKSESWCRKRRDEGFEVLKILLQDVLEEA